MGDLGAVRGARITDIEVGQTSPFQFTVVLVKNEGAAPELREDEWIDTSASIRREP